jgi:DNA-binding transcriptional LysR family regulator
MCALVQAGLGISLIPAMACQTPRSPALLYRALSPPKPRRKIVALWPRGHTLGKAPDAFLQYIRDTVAESA